MTRNGLIKRIGQLVDNRNRIEQGMIRGTVARNAPEWKIADNKIVDTIKVALAAGVPAEQIQTITWRERPTR
jgi:hypothetical protein